MTTPPINPDRLQSDLRKSVFAMRVLAVVLVVASAFVLLRFRTPTRFARQMVWLGAIVFGFLPAMTSVILVEGLKRQRYWALVTAISVICTMFFLMLIAATFVSTGIIAETISRLLWPHVVLMAALSMPFGWTIYTLMRSHDSMRPDDWNVG